MRLLIISPHFPPTNAADLHRVRLLVPYWAGLGVAVEVLAVEPAETGFSEDPWLADGLPKDVPVHRVKALGRRWSRLPGLGSLAFRARGALARKGDELLAGGRFDLVYFSTTVFAIHPLGVRWKKRFGVPFAMDYQDPWVNDYYREHPEIVPPGGRLKHGIMDYLHRRMEPAVLKECSGITAVSPAYPQQIVARYPWAARLPALVQPFPGDARDFARVVDQRLAQTIFTPSADTIHWVYAGVVIPAMEATFRAFFRALRDHAPAELLQKLRLHFLGTRYGGGADVPPGVLPIAAEYGLAHLVNERTQRLPYSEVLACLRDASALLVFGSDDPGYTASKIYPYLLAGRPLLTVFHAASSVVSLLAQVGGGACVPFTNEESEATLAERIAAAWLHEQQYAQRLPLNATAFQPYTAAASALCFADFFRGLLTAGTAPGELAAK